MAPAAKNSKASQGFTHEKSTQLVGMMMMPYHSNFRLLLSRTDYKRADLEADSFDGSTHSFGTINPLRSLQCRINIGWYCSWHYGKGQPRFWRSFWLHDYSIAAERLIQRMKIASSNSKESGSLAYAHEYWHLTECLAKLPSPAVFQV